MPWLTQHWVDPVPGTVRSVSLPAVILSELAHCDSEGLAPHGTERRAPHSSCSSNPASFSPHVPTVASGPPEVEGPPNHPLLDTLPQILYRCCPDVEPELFWQRLDSNQWPKAHESPALPLSYAATTTRTPDLTFCPETIKYGREGGCKYVTDFTVPGNLIAITLSQKLLAAFMESTVEQLQQGG